MERLHLFFLGVLKIPERSLVVRIDAHVLALGPLNPINQFGCAVADIWDDILSKKTFDVE